MLLFYVFDLLSLVGEDLWLCFNIECKEWFEVLLGYVELLIYVVDYVIGVGEKLFVVMCKVG